MLGFLRASALGLTATPTLQELRWKCAALCTYFDSRPASGCGSKTSSSSLRRLRAASLSQ
jgi:hypothetical protein